MNWKKIIDRFKTAIGGRLHRFVSGVFRKSPTQTLWICANEKEARKLRKQFIPPTMMDKFDEPDNF